MKIKSTLSLVAILLFVCVSVVTIGLPKTENTVYPWNAVGGCGAGGSGGAGGGAAKWIGKGVSGGLLNLQTMGSFTWGKNYSYFTFHNRFSGKPTWTTEIGLGVPFQSKDGSFQPRSNQKDEMQRTGGLGDLSFDISRTLGGSGQYSLTFSSSLPTGQYNIMRGPDGGKRFLPNSIQMGQGVYSPSLSFSWSKDYDRAMLLVDAAYSHPIAMRLFSGKNEFIDDEEYGYTSDVAKKDDSRFYYRFKSYGENDLGDYFPPSLTLAAYYAYKGTESRMQSIGLSFSAPLGVSWIHSEQVGRYDPRPDPDFKPWSLSILYGYEFSHEEFPFYFAVNIPITAKSGTPDPTNEYNDDVFGKWSGPDWENIFQTGTVYFGFKSTFF